MPQLQERVDIGEALMGAGFLAIQHVAEIEELCTSKVVCHELLSLRAMCRREHSTAKQI